MSDSSGSDYAGLAQRVSRAVERENRQRRRVLSVFLLLLIIPVAVGVAILLRGIEDTDWVRENARKAVEPEFETVRNEIKAREGRLDVLEADSVKVRDAAARIEPALEAVEEVRQVVVPELEKNLEDLERDIRDARQRARGVFEQHDARIDRLVGEQRSFAAQLERATSNGGGTGFAEVNRRIDGLEERLNSSRREIDRLNRAIEAAPAVREAFEERLAAVEKDLEHFRRQR